MSFPWGPKANTRTFRKPNTVQLPMLRLRRKTLSWFVALALSGAASVLDVRTVKADPPPTALPQAATQFITSGTAAITDSSATALTITQQSQKAILNWQSFNIGRDASVTFRQPDASSAALNRIQQGSPSEIFGRLSANGQIYLLNQNGIIFGQGAVVDTHTLVASTINISDQVFNNGLTDAINQGNGMAAFDAGTTMNSALIQVESGAVLKSTEGGKIMIFAPVIENRGEITTPGGQAILAASKNKVYLANSDNKDLRGLLVEVDTGGDVTNWGRIVAERGNVTLLGYAVNQNGVVRATTSVNLNGSIHLLARDKAEPRAAAIGITNGGKAQATSTGILTLGENSLTEVVPDNPAQTAGDTQEQPVSRIELVGHQVTLKRGARVVAPAGNVQIKAIKNPAISEPTFSLQNGSQFLMEAGSSIDVSGLRSAVLPMERNSVAVELRGSQLADSPLQRTGALRGETVYVDVRQYGTNANGTPWQGTSLANASGEIAKIERPLSERLSAGGTVSIVSEEKVVTEKGATIDISGGAIRYQDGYVNTTQLISQGRVVAIGSADKNQPYDGIFGTYKRVHKKWGVTETFNLFGPQGFRRFESGYEEGKDAGSVAINARNRDLQGTLRGEVTADRYQRLPQNTDVTGFLRRYDQVPLGGELTLGLGTTDSPGRIENFSLPSLTDLGTEGFNRFRIYANEITVPKDANLVLAPGGALTLSAAVNVDVQGDITAPGGKIQIKTLGAGESAVSLGSHGSIDVSGQWVNDSATLYPDRSAQDPVFINGGKVTIEAAGDLALEAGSLIDVGGGAQLQRNGKIQYGKSGDIDITGKPSLSNAVNDKPSEMRLDGELRAYSFGKGGSLSLSGAGFRIENSADDALARTVGTTVFLKPEFFARGGFNTYNLKATHTGITLASNTDVRLRAMNRVLDPQFTTLPPSGTALDRLGGPGFLPDYLQQPVSLGLSYERSSIAGTGRLELESGSSIHANPGASVSLRSNTDLLVDGTISAPAGTIQLSLEQPISSPTPPPQVLWLGPQGSLLAGAIYQPLPDTAGRGLRLGTVRDGGTVTINAGQDYFTASPSSRIDVSGTTQTLDVSQGLSVTPTVVNGAAGFIDLAAIEGMALNGDLIGAAGSGAGAKGGTLRITLNEQSGKGGTIAVTTQPTTAPDIGQPVPGDLSGLVRVNPDKIRAGGFDALALTTPTQISLEGDVHLDLARRLVLDTPVLASNGGRAELTAPYLALGRRVSFDGKEPPEPTIGTGSLLAHGQNVDLIGTLVLQGFGPGGGSAGAPGTAPVRIESDGDIRFRGGDDTIKDLTTSEVFSTGRLNSVADIALRADQIYTTTATDYTLSVSGPDGKITIEAGGASEAPLSAASKLTLTAANIEQLGTLRAPFGQIELNASNSLVLGQGSVTSVSGAGQLVPFGKTEFGGDWLYPLGPYQAVYNAPPEKRVTLAAPQVTLAPGSVVDVTGGGDLLSREQLPGPGGSTDILENVFTSGPLKGTVNTAFAIVPTQNNPFGSYDPFLSTGSQAQPGDTVYLAGGGALPAGEYALLPAGYALLPGAYLVTPLAKTASPIPGQAVKLYDGSTIVAAQRGAAGAGTRDSLWSAFLVENGAQVRTRAEYLENRADNFFAASADRLNRDAGRLAIDAAKALSLGGTLATSNNVGGRGSEVDILADRLAVVTAYTGASDRVELLDSGLNNLRSDSLLLGASRQRQGEDLKLDVRAGDVMVESGANIAAPEIMLAARDRVTVANGAKITAVDGSGARAPAAIQLTGDSALARISSGEQVHVQRTSNPGTTPGTTGNLDIAAGADLDATRSITLDASGDAIVDGNLRTDNGSLSLAAARVSVGETQGVSGGGLVLSNDRLASLNARDLVLSSRGTIDLYGKIAVDVNRLALDSAGLAGYRNAGQGVSIHADTIALSNRSGAGFSPNSSEPLGSGALSLTAREVSLSEGNFAVRGFSDTTIAATQQIIARPENDTPAKLNVAGNLALEATRITASRGADVLIGTQDATGTAVGKITLTAPVVPANLAPVTDLGGKLEIVATAIEHAGRIELPSGVVSLQATEGGVNIAPNAVIDVSGRDLAFADLTVGSPGGQVAVIADAGGVSVSAGARIDVSGATSGGDAGKVSLSAPKGEVRLDPAAQLAAVAHAGAKAGSFALDAQKLINDFSALNAVLNTAGFTDGRQFRLREGNIAIAVDDVVLAHDLRLAADAGSIDVSGRIHASGEQAGRVELWARNNLSLRSGATIDAYATGVDQDGGHVLLATGADADGSNPGRLTLESGAKINVSGTTQALGTDGQPERADKGELLLRAAREGNGVAIDSLAAEVRGANNVVVEAYTRYQASVIDSNFTTPLHDETNGYMNSPATVAQAAALKAQLGAAGAAFHFRPGIEVYSSGDLALNTNWDLLDWRYGGTPGESGVLTLRATGNLNLNQSLSDGVKNKSVDEVNFLARDTAQNGPSWSYRLAAGADLAGVGPLAVNRGVGNVTVGTGVKVRTGTGDIEIAAGKDLKLADPSAAIYTVGENRGTGGVPATTNLSDRQIQEIFFNGDFLQKGGDIRIAVDGDIQGANGHQLVNDWQSRVGGDNNNDPFGEPFSLSASWAVNLDKFQQNIGALGGGDVTVIAGGSLNQLSVVIPTTGRPAGGLGTAPDIAGGGDLHIEAGGDIRGGVFYVGKGRADMQAGGSVTHVPDETPLYPILALADGQYTLRARKDVTIETIVNPSVLPVSQTQGAIDPNSGVPFINPPPESYFFTYTPDSAARLEAVSGNVVLNGNMNALGSFSSSLIFGQENAAALTYLPGTLSAGSLQGDIVIGNGFTLLPAPRGDLELLAGGSISPGATGSTLLLSDADPALLPNILAPASGLADANNRLALQLSAAQAPYTHAIPPIHWGDTQAARIVAQTGDIGSPQDSTGLLTLALSKQARLYAGNDVSNLTLRVQHANSTDISVVEAGGSVLFPTKRDVVGGITLNGSLFEIAGPGQLYVIAGKDVDLGASSGIQSIGNQMNPALVDSGAALTVMAGQAQAPAYDAFIERYLANQDTYRERLAQYMQGLGSNETGVDAFHALPRVQQRKFILEVLFTELRASGSVAAETRNTADYDPGFAAIKTLFPAESYPGDVKSFLSQIYTFDGGDINFVVPGGLVNAGVAGSAIIDKSAGELGIVAQRDGDINALVHGNFLVNQSRVFTLDGGDILMWSSIGDIDAGKGAKTALSNPSPTTTSDKDGNTFVEFPPAIAGSGIRAAVATPGREPGNVYLIAPVGVIDAGDAGIGAAGNLTLAATTVVNAGNIQVGGISTGVPTDTGGLGASLAGVGDIAATASKVAEDATRGLGAQANENPGFLGVEVLGFGE